MWIGRRAAVRVAVLGLALVLAVGSTACGGSDSFDFKPTGRVAPAVQGSQGASPGAQ